MDEYVFAAVIAGDETKPLGVVKPFDLSYDRNGGRRIRGHPARWSNSIARRRRPLRPLDNAGSVDFEHPGHLRLLGAGANLDAQLGACRYSVVACGMQRIGVQERVASARRRAGANRRGAAPHGWAAKTACVRSAAEASTRPRSRLVRHRPVVIEAALAGPPKALPLPHARPIPQPNTE